MRETWWDEKYKYEVELTALKPVIQDGKVTEWTLKYKVISQTEQAKKNK